MIKYAFISTCAFVLGGLAVEFKDYFAQQVPVPIAVLADGGVYDGELRKGMLGGKGRIVWPSENYYEGEFENGLFQGEGTLHTSQFLYQGQFELGNPSGEGTINYRNGDQYQGNVMFGLPNGFGTLTVKAQDNTSLGQSKTKKDQQKISGDVYKGNFKDGLYHGQGELTRADGTSYVGNFENGQFHGSGVYTKTYVKKQGNADNKSLEDNIGKRVYSGTFVNGVLSGDGTWLDGNKRYEGKFLNGLFHGEGLYSDPGGTYMGLFSGGAFDGQGTYTGVDGESYKGEFLAGLYHGSGVLTFASGDVYTGGFQLGRQHGKGKIVYAEALDGIEEVIGRWEFGRLVEANHEQLAVADEQLVEHALYHQNDVLETQWSELAEQDPEKIDMYFVGVAGDGHQGVFRREVEYVQRIFDEEYGTNNKSVSLINSVLDYQTNPLATVTSIENTLQKVAEKMDKDNDILFLYLTSHGSREGALQLSQPGLSLAPLTAKALGKMLADLPVRHKVVVISSCFSGGFVSPIKDDNMMIITASEADKASFGCSDRAQLTYFGEAFFTDALSQPSYKTSNFVDAYYRARDIVRGREAKEGFENSNPLIYKPKAILAQLKAWREQLSTNIDEPEPIPQPESKQ